MQGSTSVVPGLQDLITSLDVSPSDIVPASWVQASDGLEFGLKQALRLWITSIEKFAGKLPDCLEELFLLVRHNISVSSWFLFKFAVGSFDYFFSVNYLDCPKDWIVCGSSAHIHVKIAVPPFFESL